MAWVRYDDQFYANAKVTAVIAEDPGALALHVLANTWTNGQKRMGFIPKHQPGVLICDRSQGQAWAEVLTRHGLWHECGTECESCQEEYADLPPDSVGYVIHNAKVYRAPARERTTPGTAAELSEKRREAGRRGGQASAARRNGTNESKSKQNEASGQANQANEANVGSVPATAAAEEKRSGVTSRLAEGDFSRPAETQQDSQAIQANGVSKTSNLLVAGVTPVPGSSSYEEELPEPFFASSEAKVPPTAGADAPQPEPKPKGRRRKGGPKADRTIEDDQADELTNAYWERYSTAQGWIAIRQVVRTALVKVSRDDVARALDLIGKEGGAISGGSIQTALKQINAARNERNGVARPTVGRSTTDDRVAQAQALKGRFGPATPPTVRGEIAP